ncbi:MAG: TIM-barrel domain-containing protein, partial [Lactococcus lactis]
WIDWQQGAISKSGVDPLWLLNHYQYQKAQEKNKNNIILSRYAGPGSHRYPLGFSGDSVISWASLDFQPYFTSTASNIGYT